MRPVSAASEQTRVILPARICGRRCLGGSRHGELRLLRCVGCRPAARRRLTVIGAPCQVLFNSKFAAKRLQNRKRLSELRCRFARLEFDNETQSNACGARELILPEPQCAPALANCQAELVRSHRHNFPSGNITPSRRALNSNLSRSGKICYGHWTHARVHCGSAGASRAKEKSHENNANNSVRPIPHRRNWRSKRRVK